MEIDLISEELLIRAGKELEESLGRPLIEDEFNSMVSFLKRLVMQAAMWSMWEKGHTRLGSGEDGFTFRKDGLAYKMDE